MAIKSGWPVPVCQVCGKKSPYGAHCCIDCLAQSYPNRTPARPRNFPFSMEVGGVYGVSDEEFENYRMEIMDSMTDQNTMEDLPPFDPKSKCAKCGWAIEDPPEQPPKMAKGADGKTVSVPASPPPPPRPPTVAYCSGVDCPWSEDGEPIDQHLHQFCDTCGYEWLARPLDAS